jgi:hemerythrin
MTQWWILVVEREKSGKSNERLIDDLIKYIYICASGEEEHMREKNYSSFTGITNSYNIFTIR